jgi:hypothetical protein
MDFGWGLFFSTSNVLVASSESIVTLAVIAHPPGR